MMKVIRFWFNNARYIALPQSVMPAVLAVCMAVNASDFSILPALFAVVGVIFGHLGINLLDDYFDYRVKDSSFRDQLTHQGFRARISKCDYLKSGETTVRHLFIASIVFCTISLACGLFIFLQRDMTIVYLALATAILGFSYSGGPLKFSYRGLGELQIGIMFGPLLMSGVYYAACGIFSWPVLFVSIPVGLLVANIVYTHAIMDYEPDKEVGKMTFAVLLGNKKHMLITTFFILLLSFGSIAIGVISNYLPIYYLLVFLTLPMAVSLFYLVKEFIRDPQRAFSPRFWMGPMSDWEIYKTVGIEWFMIRWLLARNLLSFFCLILMVINLVSSIISTIK
jgi:1,4-dihydroxy-2-naphthoate octaprenyltransferase